jgi:hypothetical protein
VRRIQGILNWRLLAIVLVLLIVSSAVASAKVSIVVSKASAYKPTESDIKSYFLGVKLEWPDGAKVQIVDQPDAACAKVFYEKFLGSSLSMVRKEWTKLILSGAASAPVKCASDDEVKKALAANPASLGFIDGSAVDASVVEVAKIE